MFQKKINFEKLRNLESFLPSFLQSPIAFLLATVLPQFIVLIINISSFLLIKSEFETSDFTNTNHSWLNNLLNNHAALWCVIFVVQSFLLIICSLFAYSHFKQKKQINYWWNLPFLIVHIIALFIISFVSFWGIPESVANWILTRESVLYFQLIFIMPSILYYLIHLASFKIPSKSELIDAGISLVTAISLPVITYLFFIINYEISRHITYEYHTKSGLERFISDLITWSTLLLIIFITVIMGFAIIRFVTLISKILFSKGKLAQSILIGIFALVLPIAGLILNSYIPFPFDFQSREIYIFTILNALILLIPKFNNTKLDNIIWFLQCSFLPFSIYFLLVFLPFAPLGLLATIAMGAGFLIFSPIILFILHIQKLKQFLPNNSIRKNILIGTCALLIMPTIFTVNALLDKYALKNAIEYVYEPDYLETENMDEGHDYSKAQKFKGNLFLLKRSLLNLKDFKEGIYLPFISPLYNWLVFDGLTLPDGKMNYIYKFFFAENMPAQNHKTGLLNISQKNHRSNKEALNSFSSRSLPISTNKNLQLTNISSQSSSIPNENNYKKTTLKFKVANSSSDTLEYHTHIKVPKDVFVSGLNLKINGEMKKGKIFEKKSAMWVYSMITSERRDPAILTYIEPELLDLKIFPVDYANNREFEIEFVHPTNTKNQITIGEQNFILNNTESNNTQQNLPTFKRKPYLHFIVENTAKYSLKDDCATINKKIQTIAKTFPESKSKPAGLTFGNYEYEDFGDAGYKIDELVKMNCKENNQKNNKRNRKGSFVQDRFIKYALLNNYNSDILSSRAANDKFVEDYPMIVIIRTSKELPLIDTEYDLSLFTPLQPDYPYYHVLDLDNKLQAYNFKGEKVIPPKEASEISLLFSGSQKGERISFTNKEISIFLKGESVYSNSANSKIYDPIKKEFVPFKHVPSSKTITNIRELWENYYGLVYKPRLSKTLFPELVQKSKSTGILIPITAYTVLENEAQEKVLKQKEKQKLKNNASLELMEADEPPIWFFLIIFLIFYYFNSKFPKQKP